MNLPVPGSYERGGCGTEVYQPTQRVSAEAKLAWTMPSRKEENEVNKAFDDNYVVPMGPNVEQFERELDAFVGENKRVVALSCGTAAVHLALINCGVKAGDEVLVQSFTFCASSHPITYLGAKPVFVGSEKDSWNRRTSEHNAKLA